MLRGDSEYVKNRDHGHARICRIHEGTLMLKKIT
jgi:hypothetical protein